MVEAPTTTTQGGEGLSTWLLDYFASSSLIHSILDPLCLGVVMANRESCQKVTQKRKRKPREMAIFGNYKNYYGYRICRDVKEDSRLKVFKREWFEGKDCLDIGCNQGILTINIAKAFSCRSMVGVDIDSFLVENAYWNLKRMCKRESTTRQSSNVSDSEFSEVHACGDDSRIAFSNVEGVILSDPLERVSFRKENFVKELYQESETYDTILCLSVTKWIHLNWGDDGLITLFANIWRLLRLGGILLLEPQPWKSYQKNYQVSETASLNYHNIQFHPSLFQEILLDKIGFRMVENITERLPGSAAGFDRPIFAFRKSRAMICRLCIGAVSKACNRGGGETSCWS